MKSDIFNQQHGIEHILDETERFGVYCKLPSAGVMRLRLLTEELLGLTVNLFDNLKYGFTIENEGQRFILRLKASTIVNLDQKSKMLSLSSRGENEAAKGILGRISGVFQDLIMGGNNYSHYPAVMTSSFNPYYETDISPCFSMTYYKNQAPEREKEPEWDGLEKSIIANYADDVVIGVKSDKVEMVVLITI